MKLTRRQFLRGAALVSAAPLLAQEEDRIIDIHQHTDYSGRTPEQLLAHQTALGVTTTVLLPAGKYYGLDANCGGNESVAGFAKKHSAFVYFANEIPYLGEAKETITRFLKRGAIGIGEQKFRVLADSNHIQKIATIAQEFDVPVLLHFWDFDYNMGIARFHRILEKFPKVNFIGHAQSWWGNIDKEHKQDVIYPTGKVTPGGITDRLLSDYPNMFGDLSAGSGLNALTRDEEHTRAFLDRHQNKLLFGSDCNDRIGRGPGCQGAQILAALRRMVPNKEAERKILFHNARKLLKLQA